MSKEPVKSKKATVEKTKKPTAAKTKKVVEKAATTKKVVEKAATTKKVAVQKKNTTPKKEAPKKTPVKTAKDEPLSISLIFKLWLKAWKKTFILKGRASRLELWSLLSINTILFTAAQIHCHYYLSERFLINAQYNKLNLDTIDTYVTTASVCFWIITILPIFPLVSVLIRRIHDTGRLAGEKYLTPTFMAMVLLWILLSSLEYLSTLGTAFIHTTLLLEVCFVTMLYAMLYYILKFTITAFFYPGNPEKNPYGEPHFTAPVYEDFALKLGCFYILCYFTLLVFYLIIELV